MAKRKRAPAAGEVGAIGGYLRQYEYAACCLYRLMRDGNLEGITIAEPSAGIFDDLLVHTVQEVHATQVKSSRNAKYITLATELAADELMRKMADSWRNLEIKFGDGRIKIKYIFAGFFSTSDTSLANAGSTGARHSAEFAQFISRSDLSEELIRNSVWSTKLGEFQSASGLDEQQFLQFLRGLEICDGTELQRHKADYFPLQEQARIEAIRNLFPTLVDAASAKQDWSEQELIEKLGWKQRLSLYNVHEFPVPPDFQDNAVSESKLLDAIAQASSGYISLVGPPGTGKSTLLQRSIYATADYSVSRYLAYHPERHGLGRTEAVEFLNDLIAELRSQGFYGSRFAHDNLSELRSELKRQLDQASQRFRETGRRTVIIIDGLDHVPREENPQASFLAELPAPNSVPEGVLFVLGTQRLDLPDIHLATVQQAGEPGRCITIEPLPKAAIYGMAQAANLPNFIERDEIFEACQGHPLTAHYFIESLKDAASAGEASRILSHLDGLGRSLEQIYERVWVKLETADVSRTVLGILARANGNISPAQLAQVSTVAAVEDILQKTGFLLSQSDNGRISIFHNSFRLSVAAETGKRFGRPDEDVEKGYNRVLAEIAEAAPDDDAQHWMELRYRARAGDHDSVLRLGTADYFRRSLTTFRSSGEIYDDLRLTYGAVQPTRDRVLLLNKLLIAKEVEYRLEAVSELDLVDLFLDLGDVDLATRHAFGANRTGDGWLRLVDHLWKTGDHETARRLFEANEPLEELLGGDGLDPHHGIDRAKAWLRRAQRFRSMDKLAALVDALPIKSTPIGREDAASTRKYLKYAIALGVVMDQRGGDIPALQQTLSLDISQVACLTIEAAEKAFQNGDDDVAQAKLCEAEAMPVLANLHSSWRRCAAIVADRIGATDIASRLAATLSIPWLDQDWEYGGDGAKDRCQAIYETALLGEVCGLALPTEERGRGERSAHLVNTHSKVCELGVLRARARQGYDPNVVMTLKRIILFFARERPARGDFERHKFYATLGWLPYPIVRIAEAMGGDALQELVAYVDEKVGEENSNLSGSQSFQLAFASLVYDLDGDVDSARRRIESAEATVHSDRTPHEVVRSRAEIARAFSEVGLKTEAWTCLQAMHQDTFGYWLRAKKEPQYTFWAWSYLNACEAYPKRTEISALEFARFILGMDETEGDDTAVRLVPDLLEAAGAAPRAAAGIISRLIESDLVTWAKLADSALASVAKHDASLATSALLAFSRLVVPFFHGRLDRCIPACLRTLSPAERAEPLEELLSSISRWCPPAHRSALLELVINAAPIVRGQLSGTLRDATELVQLLSTLTHGEGGASQSRADSLDIDVSSLAELLAHGTGQSEYGEGVDHAYARAAISLAGSASKGEIEVFLEAHPHLERDANAMVAFAKRMLSLNNRAAAIRLFKTAERAAYAGHWSEYLGGEKLEVQRLRVELDGDAAHEEGFDVLVSELAAGQTHAAYMFLNMDKILESITKDMHYDEFWYETENHLKQYREYRIAQPVQPISGIETQCDLLAFIVATAFDFACPEILCHARAAATLIAQRGGSNAFVRKLLQLLRQQTEGHREAAALTYRWRAIPHLREVLLAEAAGAIPSDDFVVSNLLERVLLQLGQPREELAPVGLPAFYSLVTAEADQASDFAPPPGLGLGQRPVWSDDPWTWTSLLQFPFKALAEHSGIALDLLRRRCADFMRKEGGRSAFGPEIEEAIIARLRRVDLPFAYRRPLPMAEIRAFGKVLQELVRADAVDPRVLPLIWEEIGGPSLSGFDLEPEPRPIWMALPEFPRRQQGGLDHDEWLARTEEFAYSVLASGCFVLAEESLFKVKVWRETAECSRLALPSGLDLEAGMDGIPRVSSLDDYRPLYDKENSRLVCRVQFDLFGDLEESVVTICPYVAHSLGWSRTKTRPFEFADATGEFVARTLRWVEGTDEIDRHDTELYGRGQAVLLSRNGRIQMEARYGPFSLGVRAAREFDRESGGTGQRTIVASG